MNRRMPHQTHETGRSEKGVYFAVIDVGTTGIKSLIFDTKGKRISKSYKEYPTLSKLPGQSEQNPQDWWHAACETMRSAIRSARISNKNIAAASLTTQTGTLAVMNEKGDATYPALTWMDTRESPSLNAVAKEIGLRTALMRILWMKDNHAEILKKAQCLGSVDTYLYFKLIGVFASDYSNAAYNILDISNLEWSEKLSTLCQIPLDKLPEVHSAGIIVGEITARAAKTGLAIGTPVVMGGGDQQCSTLGLGATQEGIVKTSLGTWTCMDVQIDKPTGDFYDQETGLFNVPHVIKGKWTLEAGVPSTGAVYRWFRDNFAQAEVKVGRKNGLNVYRVLDERARRTDEGAGGSSHFSVGDEECCMGFRCITRRMMWRGRYWKEAVMA